MDTIERSDRKRRLPSGVLLVLGVVLGALVAAPVGVYAATQLVTLAGTDGTTAQVTPARQLKTAEASTSQFVRGVGFANMPDACVEIDHAPAASGLVIKTLIVDVYNFTVAGSGQTVAFFSGSGCAPGTLVARHNPGDIGTEVLDFGPGLIVRPGDSLWAQATGGVRAELYSFGYKAPGIPAPGPDSPPAPNGAPVPQG